MSISRDQDQPWLDSGLEDMRRQSLRQIAIALILVGLILIPLIPSIFGVITIGSVAAVFALLTAAGAAYLISNRYSPLAAYVLIAGLIGVLGVLLTFAPAASILPWFAMVALVAGFLIGPEISAVLAIAGTLILLIDGLPAGLPLASGLRQSEILLLWAATGLSWLALRPLLIALHWSWEHYAKVREMNETLKDRQGELGRTVKSLNETLDRLDQVNRELDRARRAANEARRLKSEFAVNVSHELRTPLNLIIGFSEMMVTSPQSYEDQALPPAYREDSVAIYRNARHLSDLVDDILDLSQIEVGQMGLQRDFIALATTINEAIDTVRVLYTQKGLSLTAAVPADLPPIFADRTRLRQILINLLSNASRFVDHGGVIVEAQLEERDFRIDVTDTGSGITPEDLPHIFDEFWQVQGPRRIGGSGVGLAVSKRFVEMHGGSIWVTSDVGLGTTFTFTIPRSDNLPAMGAPQPWETWARPLAPLSSRRAVAVITEDEDAIHLFMRYLTDFSVIPLSDVIALSAFPQRASLDGVIVIAPSAVIAYRQALAARTHVPGIPVFATGLVNSRRSLAEDLGIAGHLVKPINAGRLARTLERLGPAIQDILIVDDDLDALRLLTRMIQAISSDYQIRTVPGGAEALREVDRARPDVIFLDLIMPEVDGYAVIRTLRSRPDWAEIPLIAISAQVPSSRPVISDGLTLLRSDGLSVKSLLASIQYGLATVPRGDQAEDLPDDSGHVLVTTPGTLVPDPPSDADVTH